MNEQSGKSKEEEVAGEGTGDWEIEERVPESKPQPQQQQRTGI